MWASEQRFHGAFDFAPIGKALIRPDGRLEEVNRVMAQMLDRWVSELLGQTLWSWFAAEDVEAILK